MFCFGTAQNFTEYFTGNPTDISTEHEFGVCMMGGASESDEAMQWFLNKANGGDVVVLRASGSDGYNDYMFSQLGVTINSVTTFVLHNANGATDSYVLNRVINAEAVWFAGGDQFDYVSYFKDTTMEDVLNDFINVKRGVIGGTSAGMAILGGGYFSAENGTVTNAQALGNPYHNRMTLGYGDFLDIPFLEHVITDTHYDDPDRRGRHAAFLARYAQDNGVRSYGIACNEYTAVCIDENGMASVYGEYPAYPEFAYFLQANCVNEYLPETCANGQPLTWNRAGEAIKVAKIPGTETGGNYFDLVGWSSGQGIEWQNWYVTDGTLTTSATENPGCDLLGVINHELFDVTVSPNPFIDKITINSISKQIEYALYDVSGKRIAVGETKNTISTKTIPSGVYFLKIGNKKNYKTYKLFKL